MRSYTILGVAREGWPVIAVVALAAAAVTTGASLLGPWFMWPVAVALFIVIAWAVWFFRDPERRTPSDPASLICGADGIVCFVGPGTPPPESGVIGADAVGLTRVSVFMNIFNVHVNRAPVAGVVERVAYTPGRFFNASLDKASEHNERLSLVLKLAGGGRVVVVQIAGLIARRIVCRVSVGAQLQAGERFGMIRFGSRVDHYIPAAFDLDVRVGQRVSAGETVLARRRADVPHSPVVRMPPAPAAAGAHA